MKNSQPQDLVSGSKECRQNTWETPNHEVRGTRSCVSEWKVGDVCWADYNRKNDKPIALYGTIVQIVDDRAVIQVGRFFRAKPISEIRRTQDGN